jgi:hypothetical protein
MLCRICGFHGGDYDKSRLLGWRRVALLRTDVSEERNAFIIWITRIGELGTTLAPDDGGAKFLRNVGYYKSHTA